MPSYQEHLQSIPKDWMQYSTVGLWAQTGEAQLVTTVPFQTLKTAPTTHDLVELLEVIGTSLGVGEARQGDGG